MKDRPQRPSADKTRGAILKSAQKLFSKQGFAGTSMSQIAEKAKVNKSLIYHHFKDKATLWKAVKQSFIDKLDASNSVFLKGFYKETRRAFIKDIFNLRYRFFAGELAAARMLLWQTLEGANVELSGTKHFTYAKLLAHVEKMQDLGEFRSDYSSRHILFMLNQFIGLQMFSKNQTFKDEADRQQYIDMVTDIADKALMP